ncbi:MAG: thiamine phosphate synthase [Usitatibacter sp.]
MGSELPSALRGLYAATPEMADTAELCKRVEAAIQGGAALVQYRAKDASPQLRLEQASRLSDLCKAHHVPLIINDSVELALAVDAAGVHVGRDDGDAAVARRAMPRGLVGVSCYGDLTRARAARDAGADYIGIGSMFASTTKPHAMPASLELLARAREASGLPVAAIGGITLATAPRVVAAGADMIAVISALFDADDVSSAARGFARLFATQPSGTQNVRTQPRPF